MLPEHRAHSSAMATNANAMIRGVVWQTIALSLGGAAIIIATMILGATKTLPLWAVSVIVYTCIYLSYTALHESVHQNITGLRKDLAWINRAIGTLSAFFLVHSYEMHKIIHLTHHRSTNDHDHDPDHWVNGANPVTTALRSMALFVGYFVYCRNHRDDKKMRRAFWIGLRDTSLSLGALVLIAIFVDWKLALFGYFIPASFASMTLGIFFDYLVHTPYNARARFENTRVFVFPNWLDTAVTWAYAQQNYHGVHHAFPRIPFTKYRSFFRSTQADIIEAGMPVARPLG